MISPDQIKHILTIVFFLFFFLCFLSIGNLSIIFQSYSALFSTVLQIFIALQNDITRLDQAHFDRCFFSIFSSASCRLATYALSFKVNLPYIKKPLPLCYKYLLCYKMISPDQIREILTIVFFLIFFLCYRYLPCNKMISSDQIREILTIVFSLFSSVLYIFTVPWNDITKLDQGDFDHCFFLFFSFVLYIFNMSQNDITRLDQGDFDHCFFFSFFSCVIDIYRATK